MKSLQTFVESKRLVELYKQGSWQGVLQLLQQGGGDELSDDSFFSWLQPTEENLRFISSQVGDGTLVSVGCGNGLLEWLVNACTGLRVTGLEVDRSWWERPHAAPMFLPLHFAEETTLSRLRPTALLFCYFNDPDAFRDYVRQFEGDTVVIVGPAEGRGTHSEPEPFDNDLPATWALKTFQEVGTTRDFIAVYARSTCTV